MTQETTDEPWQYRAKCQYAEFYPEVRVKDEHFEAGVRNTELFFPKRDKALYKPVADAAKAMCYGKDGHAPCPVRRECLLWSINTDEVHGIHGGKSHRERAALVRRNQAQHPELSIEEYVYSKFCR